MPVSVRYQGMRWGATLVLWGRGVPRPGRTCGAAEYRNAQTSSRGAATSRTAVCPVSPCRWHTPDPGGPDASATPDPLGSRTRDPYRTEIAPGRGWGGLPPGCTAAIDTARRHSVGARRAAPGPRLKRGWTAQMGRHGRPLWGYGTRQGATWHTDRRVFPGPGGPDASATPDPLGSRTRDPYAGGAWVPSAGGRAAAW